MDKVIKDGTDMTIGVDLGDKWSRLCVLDEHGEVCEEGRIASTADAMRKRFSTEAPCRIVIEVGTHSPWVQRLLEELGHEVITAHTQSVRLIYGAQTRMIDWTRSVWRDWAGWIPSCYIRSDIAKDRRRRIVP